MRELVRKLTETYGPSGFEEQIRQVIRAEVESLADDLQVDPLGNLIARKQGQGKGKRIILDAHMDEIGVMVTYVDEKGFARFTRIGGVHALACVGTRVLFANGTVGTINAVEKRDNTGKIPSFDQLYLDVGATSRAECPVAVGDAGAFTRPFVAQGTRLIAKALDDRIGCVVLIETLRRLKRIPHDVYFVFSVQEEVGLRGAQTSAYGIEPDLAIAVDITVAGGLPECYPRSVELGKGPALKMQDRGMITHPAVKDLLIRAAKKARIPYQLEVLELGTTDAAAIQLVRGGVPAGCVSVPCRHFHTPSEMVDEGDVEQCIQLLLQALQMA